MKESKRWNRIKDKSTKKTNVAKLIRSIVRGVFLAAATFGIFSITMLQSHKMVVEAATFGYTIDLYKWTRAELYGPKNSFYGYIMSTRSGSAYYTAGCATDSNEERWHMQPTATNPYVKNVPSFITKVRYGAAYFSYQGTDGDNGGAKKYKIKAYNLNDTDSGRYVGNKTGDLHVRSNRDDPWSFMGYNAAINKGVSNVPKNKFIMFENLSASSDFQAYTNGGTKLSGCKDSGWSKGERLELYSAQVVTYSAMGDYTIANDQVTRVEGNVFLLDDKTLYIKEGGVLSVEGTFFCNGTIICEGTIIVQENAVLMPFAPKNYGANISIQNGGCMIISNGGRVYCGNPENRLDAKKNAMLKVDNGNIINFGLLVAGIADIMPNSTIENHGGGKIALGYSLQYDVATIQSEPLNNFSVSKFGLQKHGNVKMDNCDIKAFDGSSLYIFTYSMFDAGTVNYFAYDKNGKSSRKPLVINN